MRFISSFSVVEKWLNLKDVLIDSFLLNTILPLLIQKKKASMKVIKEAGSK
jgi:hypothetical protein